MYSYFIVFLIFHINKYVIQYYALSFVFFLTIYKTYIKQMYVKQTYLLHGIDRNSVRFDEFKYLDNTYTIYYTI